ncbi:MAG: VapC toxin family PIN domain ribonuclease [Nitrospira sp. WS110]|nr:VapC toxin family PIN domain ribonuclease [Nitrospira sp. WS110]
MMLYLDTSALVKLYVDEPLSQELSAAVDEAEAVATSLLAYAEAMAAFARVRREARLSPQGYRHVVDAFEEDWSRYITVEVTDRLVKTAGNLAASRALRGYDALHLASALSLRERVPSSVMFVAFDRALTIAAKREALRIHPLGA